MYKRQAMECGIVVETALDRNTELLCERDDDLRVAAAADEDEG